MGDNFNDIMKDLASIYYEGRTRKAHRMAMTAENIARRFNKEYSDLFYATVKKLKRANIPKKRPRPSYHKMFSTDV